MAVVKDQHVEAGILECLCKCCETAVSRHREPVGHDDAGAAVGSPQRVGVGEVVIADDALAVREEFNVVVNLSH